MIVAGITGRKGYDFSGLVDCLIEQRKATAPSWRKNVLPYHFRWGSPGSLAAAYLSKKGEGTNEKRTLQRAVQKGKEAVKRIPNEGSLRLTVVSCEKSSPKTLVAIVTWTLDRARANLKSATA